MSEEDPAVVAPSRGVVWFARIMGWLCWLGMALLLIPSLLDLVGMIPESWIVRDDTGGSDLIRSTVEIPGNPGALQAMRADLLYKVAQLVPLGLTVWALVSANRSFTGISRGEYFERGTILGLRNFALAVLLYMTVAPLAMTAARVVFIQRYDHGTFTFSLALNTMILLQLIFAAVVALVSTVMAHGAKLAEENRQFV